MLKDIYERIISTCSAPIPAGFSALYIVQHGSWRQRTKLYELSRGWVAQLVAASSRTLKKAAGVIPGQGIDLYIFLGED